MKVEKLKKCVLAVILALGFIGLGACGSKPDKGTQEVIDKIVDYQTGVANTGFDDAKKNYKYTENDFSFKIFYDRNQDVYLINAWIPYEDRKNDQNWKYCFTSKKELIKYDYDSDYMNHLKEGSFKLVYRSGKFDK